LSDASGSAPRRTRTFNPLIKSQPTDRRNPCQSQGKRQHGDALAPSLPPGPADLPPDLAALVAAWPTLPEPIRAGMMAMVRAARFGGGGGR
jgi:hypothetical protein